MKEYILLVSEVDLAYKMAIAGILNGTMKSISVNRDEKDVIGNNSVSQPSEPAENKEYVKSLKGDDKRMFEIF